MTKRLLLLPALFLALAPASFAVDATPASAPDFSSFKTPDELWKQMEKLGEEPTEAPVTRAEAIVQMKAWLTTQKQAAEAFVKAFPAEPRSWPARMLIVRVDARMQDFDNAPNDLKPFREKLDEIINSPQAPAPLRGEAAYMKVKSLVDDIHKDKPETFGVFYKAADDFYEKYPEHPLAGELKSLQMQVLNQDPTPQSEEILKKLANGADPRLAGSAKAMLEYRAKIADLKTRPFELKYTAVDGQPIDVANYRGKVVLLDFWATWCGVCMNEMPEVVSTYGKLHNKGFEILGISFDQDKDAMGAVLKKQNMTWPQYFDGDGWDNKIGRPYGITQLPSSFLIDKKGMLREVGVHGNELEGAVEKLLAE